MHSPPLLAFGFESLPMLGWLAVAAAPWIIHLLSRRKYRETPWAAMNFLLEAVKKRSRHIRLEQLFLLLLRTLIVATIVMSVAEPYFERAGAIFSPGGSTHRVLVIDSSYSMAYKPNDRSRFDQAKLWAVQVVQQSAPGDGFTLIQMADPPRAVVSTPGFEAEPVRQEIENLELIHTGADLPATLGEIRKVIDVARHDSPRLLRTEVYFFSDMQRATWSPATIAAKTELRKRVGELASIARLHAIDLGQPDDDNLAVTALESHAPFVLAGHTVALTATLRDFGRIARKRQPVDLLVDGQPAGRQYCDVPAGGEAVVQFNQRFDSPGEHAVEARAAGDALEIDNHRYWVVNVRQTVRVLLIDGRPAGDPTKSSVYALSNALLAQSDTNERPEAEVDVVPWSDISQRSLGRYDCVMLSNVARFTASEGQVLENYLVHGGSLVFFLGDRVASENYNSVLADARRPILPARLRDVATNAGQTLDPRDFRHPIVQKFRGVDDVQLTRWPVEQYYKVELLAPNVSDTLRLSETGTRSAPDTLDEHATAELTEHPPQVALAVGNGDPLIITRTVRRGRVVLVTTSADTSWTMLPTWPTYLPLVRQILDWCLAGQSQPRNVSVGDTLASSLDAAAEASATIERPDGHHRNVPVTVQGDYSTWSCDDTRVSGIYTAQLGPLQSRSQLFAVNLNPSESDLASVSRDELQNEILPGIALDYQAALQNVSGQLRLTAEPAEQLHVVLLYAVVVLLLLETFFAWRMGYNRR